MATTPINIETAYTAEVSGFLNRERTEASKPAKEGKILPNRKCDAKHYLHLKMFEDSSVMLFTSCMTTLPSSNRFESIELVSSSVLLNSAVSVAVLVFALWASVCGTSLATTTNRFVATRSTSTNTMNAFMTARK